MKRTGGASQPRGTLRGKVQELQAKLEEAEEALRAIREGAMDAIIVSGSQGKQVFSLTGAESVYRLIVETMKEAALTVSLDGTILFCNGQFGELVKTPLERIVGHRLEAFVAPDQRALVASLIAQSQKESVKHRIVFQGAGGPPVPAHVSTTVLRQPDGLSICVVATDLTELEASTEMLRQLRAHQEALVQSEQRYRDLVELSPQAIVVHSGGNVVYVNPAGMRLYGAKGPEELVGRAILDLVHPEYRTVIAERIRRVFEQRVQTPMAEAKILRLDGHAVDVEATANRITYDGMPAVQVILGDITERNQAEAFGRAINAINDVIHSTFDFDEIMQLAVSTAAEAIGCETAAISLRKDERWLVSYVHDLPKDVIGRQMNDEEEPHAVLAITTKEPVAIGDAFNDQRVNRDHMKKWGIRSVLVVPLITKDEAIGVIFFNYHQSAFAFHDLHVDFATKLASSLSLALENSRLFGNLQRELTERKRAEEAITRLASFPELNPNPIIEVDEAGDAHYANPAALRRVPNLRDIGIEHPWLSGLPSFFEVFQREGRTSRVREVEVGDTWYEQRLHYLPEKQRLRVYAFDITERKRAEEALRRYQLLAERARDIVLFIGCDGRILEANQAAVTSYGYLREELLNLNIRDLRAPEALSLTAQQLAQAAAGGIRFETVHCRKDGSQFPVEVSSCGTMLGGERVLLSIIRDTTERKQAEEALRTAHDTLKRRVEELAEDMAGIDVAPTLARDKQDEGGEEIERLSRLLELRVGELAVLDRVGRALTTSLDPEGVLHLLLSEVRTLLGTEGAGVLRHDPRSHELVFVAAEGAGLESLMGQRMPATAGITGQVFSERQAALVEDVQSDPRFYSRLYGLSKVALRSMLAVPLISKGTVIGVLGAVNKIGGAFSTDDLHILVAIANAAAIAIENAGLYAAEQARRRQLEAVRSVTVEITRELDLAKVLHLITRHAEDLLGSRSGTVWLWDEAEQVLVPQTWPSHGEWIRNLRVRLGEGLAGIVAQRREGLIVNEYLHWPHALPFIVERGTITAALAEPLLYHDRLLGVLALDNEGTDRTFTGEDGELLALFASHAAIAIQNAQLFDQVRAARERMENLSRRLVEVQEEERRHIARELHDEIGQSLTGLKLLLGMEASVPADNRGQSHDEVQALVGDLLARVRELSLDLRPAMLDDLGLLSTLMWHLERYTARTDVQVVFKHTSIEGRRFAPAVETAVYRVVQEALTNVARHAGVREVTVRLWANDECLGAQVEDRGKGFQPEAAIAGYTTGGLSGMRERAELSGGRLTVESTPGIGTLVAAEFPLGRGGGRKR